MSCVPASDAWHVSCGPSGISPDTGESPAAGGTVMGRKASGGHRLRGGGKVHGRIVFRICLAERVISYLQFRKSFH